MNKGKKKEGRGCFRPRPFHLPLQVAAKDVFPSNNDSRWAFRTEGTKLLIPSRAKKDRTARLGGVTAKAGKAELTSITAMTNATVTNNRMRLIMRNPLSP
jgi:hypothetical protein